MQPLQTTHTIPNTTKQHTNTRLKKGENKMIKMTTTTTETPNRIKQITNDLQWINTRLNQLLEAKQKYTTTQRKKIGENKKMNEKTTLKTLNKEINQLKIRLTQIEETLYEKEIMEE